MVPNVLLIDNYDSFTYNLVQVIQQNTLYTVRVVPHDQATIEHVGQYDKIVFSPGPGTPEEYPILHHILMEYGTTKSILGVCLGHQAIGQYYGGNLEQLQNVYHGQRRAIALQYTDPLFAGLPTTTHVGLYHSWAVAHAGFPTCLRITSVSEDGIIMSLAHCQFDVRGVQFHPESVMTEHGVHLLKNWLTA